MGSSATEKPSPSEAMMSISLSYCPSQGPNQETLIPSPTTKISVHITVSVTASSTAKTGELSRLAIAAAKAETNTTGTKPSPRIVAPKNTITPMISTMARQGGLKSCGASGFFQPLAATARLLRQLGAAGARHPDLNAKNVLLAGDGGTALVIDVDRVTFHAPHHPRVAAANLARLARSLRVGRQRLGVTVTDDEIRWLDAQARAPVAEREVA